MPRCRSLPKLPQLLGRKIYKTGQTRGADDDVIFQNRVGRDSTVLIPYSVWSIGSLPPDGEPKFEKGFIALVSPAQYFSTQNITAYLAAVGLVISENALVFYETREAWNAFNPELLGWKAAENRTKPLRGQYVARIPATTAMDSGGSIVRGFDTTRSKGAGIRVYEYASSTTIKKCRLQLEALFWLCRDADTVAVSNGMTKSDMDARKAIKLELCKHEGLLDTIRLTEVRVLNRSGRTICPLCLEELSAQGFFNRMVQAEGREVPDLTVTQLNLFHIEELRTGVFNHRPYNLGWGHHHCNVVVKDDGIQQTIEWMDGVVQRNIDEGYYVSTDRKS